MRPLLFALAAAMLVAGCGSAKGSEEDAAPDGTLTARLAEPGEDVALIAGVSDFAPGEIRYSFPSSRGRCRHAS